MKRRTLLTAIVSVMMIFAFVSCSGNAVPEDRLGKITFGEDNSRAVTTVVKYSMEVEDLVWMYKATKLDDGYTTGQTNGFVPVAAATQSEGTTYTPTKGLSGKTLDSVGFSYGLWKIELEGYRYDDSVKNVTVSTDGKVTVNSGATPEYVSTIENHLVDKGVTYATAVIELGDNPTTKIEFGTISFEVSKDFTNVTADSKFTLSVTDGSNIIYTKDSGDTSDPRYTIEAPTVAVDGNKVTVTSRQLYFLEEGNDIVGDHTMKFVLSQELTNTDSSNETENVTVEAALYTLKYTVRKGTTTAISGTILKNDPTGTVQINTVQDIEPLTFSRALDVRNIENSTAIVSTEKTLQVGTMDVTYPEGAIVKTTTESVTVEDASSKTGTADAEQGIVRNDDTTPGTITIDANESSENYDLTLSADNSNNVLVKVEFFYGKNRVVSGVYHEGNSITEYSEGTETESYSYDSETGVMTLRVFHASRITIVDRKAVVEDGKGNCYYSFSEAISRVEDGGTIKLIQDVSISEECIVTKSLTIDLNDYSLTVKDVDPFLSIGDLVNNNGSYDVVIMNGKLISDRTSLGSSAHPVVFSTGLACSLTLEDVNLSDNTKNGVIVAAMAISKYQGEDDYSARLIIKNSTLTTTGEGTSLVNAFNCQSENKPISVDISDSTVEAKGSGSAGVDVGNYDGKVEIAITNSTIKGEAVGICVGGNAMAKVTDSKVAITQSTKKTLTENEKESSGLDSAINAPLAIVNTNKGDAGLILSDVTLEYTENAIDGHCYMQSSKGCTAKISGTFSNGSSAHGSQTADSSDSNCLTYY